VSRRSREIGIRMALGADRRQVVGSVARDVGVLAGVGLAAGFALAFIGILAAQGLSAPEVGFAYSPSADPLTTAAIAIFMAAVALAAAFVPARRAVRIAPLTALRHE
jgi:ABC-type antimicrobial peptide transport system permease subunit